MARIVDEAILVVMHVMLRKSTSVYREVEFMVVNIVSLLSSVVHFSAAMSRRPEAVSGHHSPRSSMFLRYDG